MASSALCTPCTREIFVSYIKWEYKAPYGPGLSSSPILGGQSDLWSAIGSTCGSSFVSAINAEAGVSTATASGAGRQALPAFGAIVAGAVAFIMVA